jgi:DNA-binding MarR family transcriptional regulator
MARTRDRRARLDAINLQIKEVSRLTLLFSEAMASRLGVGMTDLECLDLVALGSDVTAGALAERTGLTTGAITGAIDRLERAGLVKRRRDEMDRRKVIVGGTPATRRADPWRERMRRAVTRVLARYDDDDLAFFERALGELCEAAEVVIAAIRAGEK